jgi:hypothetical protein
LVNDHAADLDIAYVATSLIDIQETADNTFTIAPPPFCASVSAKALEILKGPHTFVSNSSLAFSSSVSSPSSCSLSSEDLLKLYVGKNVLNEFRQHNGYKEGTYIKVWSGKEDNEYLTDIMNNVKLDSENLKDDVYQALRAAYVTYA